jgi:hypothetical protein
MTNDRSAESLDIARDGEPVEPLTAKPNPNDQGRTTKETAGFIPAEFQPVKPKNSDI